MTVAAAPGLVMSSPMILSTYVFPVLFYVLKNFWSKLGEATDEVEQVVKVF